MNVVLVMFRENGERRSFSLTRDVTVIGRREDADFRIPLSDVSRKHCRLIKDGNQLIIEDLGSANGTYHNGQRVQDSEVNPGDTIQIGPIQFVVQIDGVPSEEELMGTPGDSGESAATHVPPAASRPPAGPPPVPPTLPVAGAATAAAAPSEPSGEDDLEVLEEVPEELADPAELIEIEPDALFDNISTDSVAEEDIVIDLGEPEESESR